MCLFCYKIVYFKLMNLIVTFEKKLMMRNFLVVLMVLVCFSCKDGQSKNDQNEVIEKAETKDPNVLLAECINAHGGDVVTHATREMMISNRAYFLKRDGFNYEFRITNKDSVNVTVDILTNERGHERLINGELVKVDEGIESRMTALLEDHLFILDMPFSLSDNFLSKEYLGKSSYNNNDYDILLMEYKEVDGVKPEGKYMCYINSNSKELDYVIKMGSNTTPVLQILSFVNGRKEQGILFKDMERHTLSKQYFNSSELYYVFNNKKIIKGASPKMSDIKVTIH